MPKVCDSSTVMTPSLPTLSMASGDLRADLVVGGGDAGHLGDLLLGIDLDGLLGDGLHGGGHSGLDAGLDRHGGGAGGHVPQPLAHHGPGQDGGGGGAVAGHVVGLLGDLLTSSAPIFS